MKVPNMKVPKMKIPKFLKSVKYTLAAVNSVFLFTGVLLLLAGVATLVVYSRHEGLITQTFYALSGLAIATGVIIMLGSAFGFYAAYSKKFYYIAGYVILLIVILVFEISLVTVNFRLSNDAATDIRPVMVASMRLYGTRREITAQWDNMHTAFECCGAVSRFDWVSNRIPVSCCYIDFGTISPFECTTQNAHTMGCAEALGDWLGYNAFVLAVVSLVATCLQVPITATASWLAWRAKYEEVELES